MENNKITKELLYNKAMELNSIWDTLNIIYVDVDPNPEMIQEKAIIVGKLQMINELIDCIDETT